MDKEPTIESPQQLLKLRLLAKEISPEGFLMEINSVDQSTPGREKSIDNLAFLVDPEVVECFKTEDEKTSYLMMLAFTHFHVGQNLVEVNPSEALTHFEEAFKTAKQVDLDGYDVEWHYYEATIAYLKIDIKKLEDLLPKVEAGRNREVISNFIKGLKERGIVDYYADYNQ